MTMRKRIAFLAGAISFDNQNRVLGGVLKRDIRNLTWMYMCLHVL